VHKGKGNLEAEMRSGWITCSAWQRDLACAESFRTLAFQVSYRLLIDLVPVYDSTGSARDTSSFTVQPTLVSSSPALQRPREHKYALISEMKKTLV
jgi:hypothetical protein